MSRQERDVTGRTIVRESSQTVSSGPTSTPGPAGPSMADTQHKPIEATGPTMTESQRRVAETAGPVITETQRTPTSAVGTVTWSELGEILRREPMSASPTWRPTVGGLLAIISGSWNLLLGIGSVAGGAAIIPTLSNVPGAADIATKAGGAFFIVIGILSIIGGAFALSRRNWPMVLVGSITAAIPSPIVLPFLTGVLALLFNVLGHKEFWGPKEFQKDALNRVAGQNFERLRNI